MKEFPEKFRDGYTVGSVYGTFPGAIWNGGRAVLGSMAHSDMEKIIKTYNSFNVPVRFTWTNSLIEEKHLNDTYCNLIMETADNGMNQVLVNREVLEDYLRANYPKFKFISSTTKRITDLGQLEKEYDKDYELVVLDYDLNHNQKVLDALQGHADKTEILVDEICFPNCPKRKQHYKDESYMQLHFEKGKCFDCPNTKVKPSFEECKKRPSFISNEEIGGYIDKGYVNFKIVGRGLPQSMVEDSYMYYLVKDEHREFIRNKLDTTINRILKR
jgi:collagenase-like PrtC family protease